MIILKSNLELKLTFEKLIRMTKERVEWNGNFVIVGDYLILHGRVRSLFFNFENRKVYSNIIDIPVKEEEIIQITEHPKIQNVLNIVLYAFGKWGTLRGVKVEQDYAQLNNLFISVLQEAAIEPGYGRDNFRFYREGVRINYEDVIQYMLEVDEKQSEESVEAIEEEAGLWHKLVWKKKIESFHKTETTYEQRQKNRVGNNFYMVGYQCPKCRDYLHMVVYPVGKEFRIETTEGGVFLARAYTCDECNCFYTPRPEKLLSDGDVYFMDFLRDRHAYEDYLELLGKDGDRVSNYKYNEFEEVRKRKAQMQMTDQEESLEKVCGDISKLDDEELSRIIAKIEEGFYPAKSVQRLESKIQNEMKYRKSGTKEKHEETKNTQSKKPKSEKVQSDRAKPERIKLQAKNTPLKRRKATRRWNPLKQSLKKRLRRSSKGIQRLVEQTRKQRPETESQQVIKHVKGNEIPVAKRESAKKRYLAKCNVLDRLSSSQMADLKRELAGDKNLYEEDKAPFYAAIKERESRGKKEHIQKLAASCKNQNYAKMGHIIDEIKKLDVSEEEKEAVLEPLYRDRIKQGEAEVLALVQNMPSNLNRKQYASYMEQLKNYPDVNISSYESVLEKKKEESESQEISDMIHNAKTADRKGLTDLITQLKNQNFEKALLAPHIEELEEKLRIMDEAAIEEICGNPEEMTAKEALEAYQKIEEGIFLPELKTNALEMLRKRLEKLKTDECELLVRKLEDSLKDKIKENDRHHFYPAKRVMNKEATQEELQEIQFALDTYGTKRGTFEYPILVIDTSRNRSGKEGLILTPEHLFCRTLFRAFYVPIGDIKGIKTQTGLLNAGISICLQNGDKIKIPYAVERKELTEWGNCLKEFIQYLQEKPESRELTYLAQEKHETICCFRCGFVYKGGNICPKCGYKMNQ